LPLLLDTNVVIDLLEDVPSTIERVSRIDGQFLSVISHVELEAGLYRDGSFSADRRARFDGLLQQFEELDFTTREAAAYSAIIAARGFSRRLVADRMIAATAITHGLTLATLNRRDFRDIPGLTVEDWSA
jgi:predicted nucleic acid-binding protein